MGTSCFGFRDTLRLITQLQAPSRRTAKSEKTVGGAHTIRGHLYVLKKPFEYQKRASELAETRAIPQTDTAWMISSFRHLPVYLIFRCEGPSEPSIKSKVPIAGATSRVFLTLCKDLSPYMSQAK